MPKPKPTPTPQRHFYDASTDSIAGVKLADAGVSRETAEQWKIHGITDEAAKRLREQVGSAKPTAAAAPEPKRHSSETPRP